MSTTDTCYKALEREFESTLTGEIIPGILHNFANPLNGIMGRSKLLQRKLEMNSSGTGEFTNVEGLYPKLFRDVDLISRDTDKLSSLLQNVAEKFYVINKTAVQRINLSEIIGIEMSFFDFYLDFKHNIKKTVDLNPDLPEISGVPAEYSLSLWSLIREAMLRIKDCESREFRISTGYEDRCVRVDIANTGTFIEDSNWRRMMDMLEGEALEVSDPDTEDNLLRSLWLLKKYRAEFKLGSTNGLNVLTIVIPAG